MEAEIDFSHFTPPIFDGESYELWAMKMESYLEALDLWELVEEDFLIPTLIDNPSLA